MDNSRDIIIDELNEQGHPEQVEHVIFWALEYYAKRGEKTWGEIIAKNIVDRIKDSEKGERRSDSDYYSTTRLDK